MGLTTQLVIILLLKVIIINGFYSSISFPITGVYHSIGSSNDDPPVLPTGNCQDLKGRGLSLFLPRVSLRSLYPGIISSPEVSCLSFRNNYIDRVGSGTFHTLPNLLYLDLSKNRIPVCNLLSFGGSYNRLQTLILDENELPVNDFGRDIIHSDCFPSLESLYMRNNYLRSLQFSLRTAFPNLRHLYLSDNYIENEHFTREVPSCLTYLHLQRNHISKFGGGILENIEFLFLDNNRIRSVCNSYCVEDKALRLDNARRLKYLSVTHNEIVRIEEDSFGNSRDLLTLDLANNKIETIKRATFQNLKNLKELDLTGNCLTKIPDLNVNKQLLTISLGYNKIETIRTGSFRELEFLKKIILSNNRICKIETDSFIDLINLEELDLSHNRLHHLDRFWMRQQGSLKSLDVRGNLFTAFAHLCLESARHLSIVYMQNNPLISVSCTENLSYDTKIHVKSECKAMRGRCYEVCIAEQNVIW